MATAKQLQARKRFKKAIDEAKKLMKKDPKLNRKDALKRAFAIEYSKEKK